MRIRQIDNVRFGLENDGRIIEAESSSLLTKISKVFGTACAGILLSSGIALGAEAQNNCFPTVEVTSSGQKVIPNPGHDTLYAANKLAKKGYKVGGSIFCSNILDEKFRPWENGWKPEKPLTPEGILSGEFAPQEVASNE